MTYARREIVHSQEVGIYHCMSRCVRRAFLCGFDTVANQSFEHRREWIRARLSHLTEVFAIEVIAYAVMSNHLHILIRNRPDLALSWSAKEVARRWRMLFPLHFEKRKPATPTKEELHAITASPEKVELYRERLSNISWFNRCLNEHIARRANAEDQCKGRFWEGRFKCQRVFDVAGVLACAVYIDLNPIRAGKAKTLEGSDHTSVQDRIHAIQRRLPKRCKHWTRVPLVELSQVTGAHISAEEYIAIVEATGRQIVAGKGSITPEVLPLLFKLGIVEERWIESTTTFKRKFRRVVGPEEALVYAAKRLKQHWVHGIQSARELFFKTSRA